MERLPAKRAVSRTCSPKTGDEDQEMYNADRGISGGVGSSDLSHLDCLVVIHERKVVINNENLLKSRQAASR